MGILINTVTLFLMTNEEHDFISIFTKDFFHFQGAFLVFSSFLMCFYHIFQHSTKKSHPWYQMCSNGIDNDNIDQCANVIDQQNNVNSPTRRLKRRQWKNMSLLSQNIKPCISHSQWMHKRFEWHHGMQSSPHHWCNWGGESPWGLPTEHKCNESYWKPEDGGGLI